MTITLSGATITRIEEESKRLDGKRRRPYCQDSIGDDHRAIEDFIETVLPMLPAGMVQRVGVKGRGE